MSANLNPALLPIIEQLPTHPRSGDLLLALNRAEQVGFERGLAHAARLEALRESAAIAQFADVPRSPFLSRQAE